MHTEYLSQHDVNALNKAIITSIKTGNRSVHHILKDAQRVIAEQQARITELNRLATTDELTGILNRRGFMQVFGRELDRVTREKKNGLKRLKGGLLIMIDLDNFKGINDIHGHAAGDAALKLVAKTLQMDIRKMDAAGRMGGDEFVILFTSTSREQAIERIQRLIKTLNSLSFIWEGKEIDVRASLGIKEYKPGDKIGRIFSAADTAMYSNKSRIKDDAISSSKEVAHA
ncbi:MAG: GGDEF domain-containing protein [Micavibrio sp.]|nr:GGDEF domain-containing protein [Micavibrio sp.]|tara:strand:- start:279 stop:965 length:687 start_codon:yes stop_codon:yes gene_type:complete